MSVGEDGEHYVAITQMGMLIMGLSFASELTIINCQLLFLPCMPKSCKLVLSFI